MPQANKRAERLVKLVTSLGDALLFSHLDGTDGLSQNGEFRVTVLSRRGDVRAEELLGKSVSVVLTTPRGGQREFNGLAAAFYQTGSEGRFHQYLIVVRPWTWLLTRTSDCRIFQGKTTREILAEVFADHPYADFRFDLSASYSPWPYCVQYRETDYNFVARLMEQEGMHFCFSHAKGKHTLVIADGNQAHDAAPGYARVSCLEPESDRSRQVEGLRDWSYGAEIQPTRFVMRDFDFEKPGADMQASADPARPAEHEFAAGLDVYDYPGEYGQRSEGSRLAQVRIEELRQQYDLFRGEGNAAGLATGGLFTLEGHPRQDQNQEYLIVSAQYTVRESDYESGSQDQEVFSVRLRAIPAVQTFQAPRITPAPVVQGPQTAIVVGKGGEEIHTDQYGRVKVQFHWDRYGRRDENSSCWIRVSQPWAGQNWGMVAIPRVGQEVVVEFLEGDPDRPLITGRVYNAAQMPPYALPDHMTQTGIKTRSSQGGGVGNFNELRFEDKKGAEQLYFHAERNQDIEVENDETHWVGHDRRKTVDHDETVAVKHDRSETVGNNETISIGANRSEDVAKDETVNVGANRSVTIGANDSHEVGKNHTVNIGVDRSVTTGRNDSHDVGKNHSVTIGENQQLDMGKARNTHVGTDDVLQVGKRLQIEAGDEITLKTGDASITLRKNGNIEIKGKDITLQGSGKIGIKASGDVVVKGSKIANN